MIDVEKTSYRGWQNCYRLTDGTLEVVVSADFGPRILHFAAAGSESVLFVDEQQVGKRGGDAFCFYGGHRLWRAPEDTTLTYYPDNAAVDVTIAPNGVTFTAPLEATSGLQKTLFLRLENGVVTVEHRFFNGDHTPLKQLALWAVTMLRPGGCGVVPLAPRRAHTEHVLPTQSLVLWGYTDFEDPRWTLTADFIALRQRPDLSASQKVGVTGRDGQWQAYVHPACGTFVKRTQAFFSDKVYPDMGASVELFTNGDMLELETLGPLHNLQPNAQSTHTEFWQILPENRVPQSKADIRAFIAQVGPQLR